MSNATPNGSGESSNQSPFTIHGQYIKDLSFENLNFIERLQIEGDESPDVQISLETNLTTVSDNLYEVIIDTKIEAKNTKKDMKEFLIELSYAGLVSLSPNLEESMVPIVLMVHVPTLLFPFIRQIIGNLTTNASLPPLFLAPIDFAELFMQQQRSRKEEEE